MKKSILKDLQKDVFIQSRRPSLDTRARELKVLKKSLDKLANEYCRVLLSNNGNDIFE